jgi:CheY-like chemotaxis protein
MAAAALNAGSVPRRVRTVLVVEDEVLVRLMMAEELRISGFEVVEAANADEALALLAHVAISAIVSDIRMPGSIDGLGLAKKVREQFPHIRIILTSGHIHSASSVHLDGFFSKPYEPQDIINLIHGLLEQESTDEP